LILITFVLTGYNALHTPALQSRRSRFARLFRFLVLPDGSLQAALYLIFRMRADQAFYFLAFFKQ
jgi:hypothetical protein